MSKMIDLTGRKFGSLLPVRRGGMDSKGTFFWQCVCDCGKRSMAYQYHLISGHTKSCGCHARKAMLKSSRTHGLSKHPLWTVWYAMRQRCGYTNGGDKANIKNYKDRGIQVCNEWLVDFKKFYDWAISNGWENGLEIDRINNNDNYKPINCRFITRKENSRNTRVSKWWVIHGKLFTSRSIAASFFNVDPTTILLWCKKHEPFCYSVQKYE